MAAPSRRRCYPQQIRTPYAINLLTPLAERIVDIRALLGNCIVAALFISLASTPLRAAQPSLPPLRHLIAAVGPQTAFVLFFDFQSSELTPRAKAIVKDAETAAIRRGTMKISVTGHSDTIGSLAYNETLSERRAEAVKAELIRDGFKGEITSGGKSFSSPLVKTGPGITQPQNRRATIEFEQ